jgi:hypothetical protein
VEETADGSKFSKIKGSKGGVRKNSRPHTMFLDTKGIVHCIPGASCQNVNQAV